MIYDFLIHFYCSKRIIRTENLIFSKIFKLYENISAYFGMILLIFLKLYVPKDIKTTFLI